MYIRIVKLLIYLLACFVQKLSGGGIARIIFVESVFPAKLVQTDVDGFYKFLKIFVYVMDSFVNVLDG